MPAPRIGPDVCSGLHLRARVPRPASSPGAAPAAAPPRRALAGLPGLLRAAGGELLHDDGAADERRLRLHVDADQHPARRAAHAPGRRLRRRPQDLPQRDLRRVQGQPVGEPDGLPRPGQPGPGGPGGAARPGHHGRQLRGGRRHRHAHRPGGRAGHGRADRHRRPRRPAAGQRPRHRALPAQGRLGHDPLHAGGGRDQVRPHARRSTPTSRRCAATRATTCPASRAWGRRPRPSGSASTAPSTRWSTRSTRSRARSARSCASTCRR